MTVKFTKKASQNSKYQQYVVVMTLGLRGCLKLPVGCILILTDHYEEASNATTETNADDLATAG